jgi:Mg2+ and Co2+ transporter CorA
MAAQIANNTNRSLSLLTGVTTLLLPPTFLTGSFGMNVKGLPSTDDEFGLIYALAMCVLSSLAMYVAVRRMGILR